jgi:uncharacterized protein with von Willebrand factor type A (vWA) domain
MPRSDDLFPREWMTDGVKPDKLSEEVVDTDRWDREDRARMLKEMPQFAASKKKLGEFARTGEPAMADMFAVLLKAEPEVMEQSKVKPGHLVNRRILEQAMSLDVTERLRRYTVNDDVQAALSCEQVEPDMETLFDMTSEQQKRAEELERALASLAQARQDGHDLDDMVRRWAGDEGVDICETCMGTGKVPDPNAQQDAQGQEGEGDGDGDGGGASEGEGEASGQGDGQGEGEAPGDGQGHGQGAGTQPCPDCGGTGHGSDQGDGESGEGEADGEGDGNGKPSKSNKPGRGKSSTNQPNPGGGDRGTELTDEQRQRMEEFAQEQEKIRQAIEKAQAEAKAAGVDFEAEMNSIKATMRGHISDMLTKAEEAARESNEIAMTWGMEPGELQRLPAQERMDLAKRLNNERFRRVAKLFGPMRNMMLSEQQRKVIHTNEEVYDVTIGNDLGRVLPQEIINLRPGPTRLDFLRRFTEGKLLQYDMQGKERLAKGAIIFCEDGSGSMSGEREMWAKAVMLCLLHLARQQKRSFHLIHFSGPGQFRHLAFEAPTDFTLERILDAAETFFGGGTDFATPMIQAMGLLDTEFKGTGRVKADVVFVTDDECMVTEAFMQEYLEFMHKVQSTTWGISVAGGQRREGALDTMTEKKVATIADFLTGEDVRSIFRGV